MPIIASFPNLNMATFATSATLTAQLSVKSTYIPNKFRVEDKEKQIKLKTKKLKYFYKY